MSAQPVRDTVINTIIQSGKPTNGIFAYATSIRFTTMVGHFQVFSIDDQLELHVLFGSGTMLKVPNVNTLDQILAFI